MGDNATADLAYTSNFVTIALLDLVHCLKNEGALGARQYENALRNHRGRRRPTRETGLPVAGSITRRS
jgi:hypothetical protein